MRKPTFRICENIGADQLRNIYHVYKKVEVGNNQEKTQSERDSHSKNRDGKKTKLTIRYLYHENIS